MLVTNTSLGASLATTMGPPLATNTSWPQNRVVLMRNHGYALVAENLQLAVFQAMFTQTNAQEQRDGLMLASALGYGATYAGLSATEAQNASAFMQVTADRPWALWVAEVENDSLYKNALANVSTGSSS